jgi:hypothetical protein
MLLSWNLLHATRCHHLLSSSSPFFLLSLPVAIAFIIFTTLAA